jgi:nitrite reductase/ring-hydroxylating ferredoxin subunit
VDERWARFESKYADASAKCGTCPHRGFPLGGVPAKRGVVVCPGHGLAWDQATGRNVPRYRVRPAAVQLTAPTVVEASA